MINWARIDELKEELGSEDFEEVFEIFLDEVAESVAGLQAAAGGDELAALLHSVKGNALTVGFRDLAVLAGAGETATLNGEKVDVATIATVHTQSIAAFAAGRA